MRFLSNGERLPNLLSCGRIQRYQGAARRATLILVAQSDFLASGHRHEDPAVVVFQRAHDLGARMRIDAHLPQKLAGSGIHGVGSGALVSEECCVSLWLTRELGDENSRSRWRLGFEGPVLASCIRVQGIDLPIGAG